jgi:pseudomonalisin
MIPFVGCRKLCVPIIIFALASIITGVRAKGQTPAASTNRIPANPNLAMRSPLTGHLPSWVTPENDAGEVPDSRSLDLTFVLSRAPLQQAEFNQLLADQQNPTSSRYHRWLTPQQIGNTYGPTEHDVRVLTDWLTSQGLRIDEVAPSKMFVRVSATAGIAGDALSTTFRIFRIPAMADGRSYVSAITEPSIPMALIPIVAGIAGLTDLPEGVGHLTRDSTPRPSSSRSLHPETTLTNGEHLISPGDFAVLYDVKPVYEEGFDGTGQRIAIIGLSRVNSSDIMNFEARVDLPNAIPNVVVAPSIKYDPKLAGGDSQQEATLDVERVVGTAPGAQIDLIVTCVDPTSTECFSSVNAGVFTDANHNVQTLLDPIMTISFYGCEALTPSTYVMGWDTLFSQAAAEGISVFVSSGDSGAAGCATHDMAPQPSTLIKSPNFMCASGSVTCVGGTEFSERAEGGNPSMYWAAKNDSATQTSAMKYIPEGAWNEPGAQAPFIVEGTGGGKSAYITKPAFQTGVGVPADGYRDTPDVSLSAALHDAYFGCYTDPTAAPSTPNPCVPDPTTNAITPYHFYGTSASTPSMAAVSALLNQKLGSYQGNLNPLLYRLAANPSNGVFHNVTVESSGVTDCTLSVPSMCNNSVPTSANTLMGGLAGYTVSPGYNQATGWGSIDVANLLAAATGVMSFTVNPTSSSLSISASAMGGNQDVLTLSSIGGFNGKVALTCTINFSGTGSATHPPACSFFDEYVTLVSGGTGTATLNIGTVASALGRATESSAVPSDTPPSLADASLLPVLFACLPVTLLSFRRRHSYRVLILLIGLLYFAGCGGSGITKGPYKVVVTGTATTGGMAMTSSTSIDVTVQ